MAQSDPDFIFNLHPLQADEPDETLLFHYTRAESLAAMLDNGTIRLGPYSKTNDPRESKRWEPVFTLPADEGRPAEVYLDPPPGDVERTVETVDRLLRRGARLACFCLDRERRSPVMETLFHRGWARARMWNQYADEHRGACLVFDRDTLFRQVDEAHPTRPYDLLTCGKVEYKDEPLRISIPWKDVIDYGIEDVLEDPDQWRERARHLYTTKNTDWESECEFRFVRVVWDQPQDLAEEPLYVPFGTSLKAIILGEKFPETERSVLTCRPGIPEGVEVLDCFWSAGVPCLYRKSVPTAS